MTRPLEQDDDLLHALDGKVLKIGKYIISKSSHGIYIMSENGEGGVFKEDDVFKVIDKFFWEKF
jgi:hypothetical protein